MNKMEGLTFLFRVDNQNNQTEEIRPIVNEVD